MTTEHTLLMVAFVQLMPDHLKTLQEIILIQIPKKVLHRIVHTLLISSI